MIPSTILCLLAPAADGELVLHPPLPVDGAFEWEVELPAATHEDLLVLAGFRLVERRDDGAARDVRLEDVLRAAPLVDEEGEIVPGMFRAVALITAGGAAAGRTYELRVAGTLQAHYEAEGLDGVSAPVAGPEEKAWLRLGEDHPSLRLTPRFADDGGDLALDFTIGWADLELERFGAPGDLDLRRLALVAGTEGYYKTDLEEPTGEDAPMNSLATDLSLRYEEFRNDSAGARQTTAWGVDVHGAHEATQDFEADTWNLGVGLHVTPGFLLPTDAYRFNVLDASEREELSAPRFYLGYDRVTGAGDTSREARTGERGDAFDRLEAAAAWGFPVLGGESYLETTWRGFYDLDADVEEYESLVEVTLHLDLAGELPELFGGGDGDHPPFVVKYVDGGLPPDYGDEHSLSAGWSFQL